MKIIGIDPGTATTGFGIIEFTAPEKLKYLDHGCIKTSPSMAAAQRLLKINQELAELLKNHRPDVLAVESLYFFKNLKTAMPVSQAKGVILFTAAVKKIPIYEFTPLQVKMTLVGYGRAEKKQVQEMVKLTLNLKEIPRPDDSADALAIAICYTRASKMISLDKGF
ncbi:MAG: crossover junction endodeoxyribonuclease RuvC [bacterium]